MPRLPNKLLRRAQSIDRLLPLLVRQCRDLNAAQNELRWLREHVSRRAKARSTKEQATLLRKLAEQRASGKPLQYILGTEYFGNLELLCRPKVLIPRQETAASVMHLVNLLRQAQDLPSELRVLDLCTGSGCIPLLFHHEFSSAREHVQLRLLGMDISEHAIKLARDNRERVRRSNKYKNKALIEFMRGDVLAHPFNEIDVDPMPLMNALNFYRKPNKWDVLISNPPYISPSAFWKTTTRSVRGYEPKLALVPPEDNSWNEAYPVVEPVARGDEFYHRILQYAMYLEPKVVLFEVADLDQAVRVAHMARSLDWFGGIEIWRDDPRLPTTATAAGELTAEEFPIIGTGNGRSVLCYRNKGAAWLGKSNRYHNLPKGWRLTSPEQVFSDIILTNTRRAADRTKATPKTDVSVARASHAQYPLRTIPTSSSSTSADMPGNAKGYDFDRALTKKSMNEKQNSTPTARQPAFISEYQAGASAREIATKFQVATSTVYSTMHKWRKKFDPDSTKTE